MTELATSADDPIFQVFEAVARGDWFLLAATALALITLAVRTFLVPKGHFFSTDRGGVALVSMLGTVLGIAHAIVAGAKLDETVFQTDAKIVIAAIGQFVIFKKLARPSDQPPSGTPLVLLAAALLGLSACGPTHAARAANTTSALIATTDPIAEKLEDWAAERETVCVSQAHTTCIGRFNEGTLAPANFRLCIEAERAECRKDIPAVRAGLKSYRHSVGLVAAGASKDLGAAIDEIMKLARTIAKVIP